MNYTDYSYESPKCTVLMVDIEQPILEGSGGNTNENVGYEPWG